jgi:hypothetical protein
MLFWQNSAYALLPYHRLMKKAKSSAEGRFAYGENKYFIWLVKYGMKKSREVG